MRLLLLLAFSLLFTADERFLPWDAATPLQWGDFQGPVPDDATMSAKTVSKFTFNWSCDTQGKFSASVKVNFDRELSWAKDGGGSDALLAHEQLHFDIAELTARKFRKELASLPSPCEVGKEGMNALSKKYREMLAATQVQYDKETNHSEVEDAQARWEVKVAKELKALSAFADQ